MRRVLRKIAAGRLDDLGDTSTLADPGVVQVGILSMRPLSRRWEGRRGARPGRSRGWCSRALPPGSALAAPGRAVPHTRPPMATRPPARLPPTLQVLVGLKGK